MVYATRAIGFLGLLVFATGSELPPPIQVLITSPTAGCIVCIGSGLDVRWGAITPGMAMPDNVTSPTPSYISPMGTLNFVQNGNVITDHPAASNFPITDEHVKFTVQTRKLPGMYQLAMANYSGLWSQSFELAFCDPSNDNRVMGCPT